MEAIEYHKKRSKKYFSPTRRIAFSFFIVIIIGSFLLSMPLCVQGDPVPFIDHLFIATSATCVTGLVPLTVADVYSLFGQIIILILIQIGGLGFLTLLNMLIVALKRKLSYTNKIIMQEALNQNSMKDIGIYIKRVIKYTFFFEMLGALLLSLVFIPQYGIIKGIYFSFFHSISAFCNAGFDVLGNNSLMNYQTNVFLNLVVAGLIISGGLGYVVWIDLCHSFKKYKDKFKVFQMRRFITALSIHTKLVLFSTTILLLVGTLSFLILEYNNNATLGQLPFLDKVLVSFFQSTTLRTAGFATIDVAALNVPTKLISSFIMFIGGSPAGTAGGVKTVTFVLIILHIHALIIGSNTVKVMRRAIPEQVVKRALTIVIVSFFIVITGLFVLTVTENFDFIDLTFEVFSAFATVGLTAGLTPLLSVAGKIVIIILMYIGRIGPITMVLMFAKKYSQMKGKDIVYPTSDVLIG